MLQVAGKNEKVVDEYISRILTGLPPEQVAEVFDQMVVALWRRSSHTLSDITLSVIFDRVLYISSRRFPLLSPLTLSPNGCIIEGLSSNIQNLTSPILIEAFRYFFLTLLNLLGNLTADILVDGLYIEFATFSPEKPGVIVKFPKKKDQICLKGKL